MQANEMVQCFRASPPSQAAGVRATWGYNELTGEAATVALRLPSG